MVSTTLQFILHFIALTWCDGNNDLTLNVKCMDVNVTFGFFIFDPILSDLAIFYKLGL